MNQQAITQMIATGAERLRAGDAASARRLIGEAIDALASSGTIPLAPPWFLMAQACLALGDGDGEKAALDALLAREPRHLAGLLMAARLKSRTGDARAAVAFYQTALAVVEQVGDPAQVPPSLRPWLDEGMRFIAAQQQDYAAHLENALNNRGVATGSVSPRVDMALDLLLGRRSLYLQQPTSFYFPGLPQRQFYEPGEFDWAEAFEAAAPAMRAELDAILNQDAGFEPYVRSNFDRPLAANHLRDDPSWGALYLWEYGERVAANADRAPATMAALERVPAPVIGQRSPMALYSLLKPGTHIKPHHGLLNTRLICHLPLITNPDCALRVGNETRAWEEGRLLIFDDSIEHEAWNRGATSRFILLFEIWRPEIDADERAALTVLFEAINAYGALPRDQG